MWAWYGVPYGPPASVRSTVEPGTLASAAALTLAATSLESAWRWSRAGRVCVEFVPEDEDPDDVPSFAASAMAEPPRARAPRAATVMADLRMVVSKGDASGGSMVDAMLGPAAPNQPMSG